MALPFLFISFGNHQRPDQLTVADLVEPATHFSSSSNIRFPNLQKECILLPQIGNG